MSTVCTAVFSMQIWERSPESVESMLGALCKCVCVCETVCICAYVSCLGMGFLGERDPQSAGSMLGALCGL